MTMLSIKAVGDEATFTVATCEETKGNFGPQVKFTSTDGDVLFMPADSAERQIRFAFSVPGNEPTDYAIVVGETIRVYREENKTKGAKPYWALALATPADAAPKAPAKRLSAPPVAEDVPLPPEPGDDFDDLLDDPYAHPTPPAHAQRGPVTPQRTVVRSVQPAASEVEAVMLDKRRRFAEAYKWSFALAKQIQGATATADSIQSASATALIWADRNGAI